MDRNRVQAAAVAAIGILAVAMAAASITSAVTTVSGPRTGMVGSGDGGFIPLVPGSGPLELFLIPFFREFMVILVLVGLVVIGIHLIRHWRDTVQLVAAMIVSVVLMLLLVHLLPRILPPTPPPQSSAGNVTIPAMTGGGQQGTAQPLPAPVVVVLILGVGMLGAVIVLSGLRSGGVDEPAMDDEDEDEEEGLDPGAVGRAAGRAADRIEDVDPDVDVDNEVYRAWRDMVDLLDVADPETTTPGEFAEAAVGAGMRPADVNELTRLFEDVRYGGHAPSAEYERRAVDTLRRIEDEYGDG